jgi:hypothetical protein
LTKIEALNLFNTHNDAIYWEYTKYFDLDEANKRFRHFAHAFDIATRKTHPIETGTSIQDASFHSQIDLGGTYLRFSNFGNMVTVDDEGAIDSQSLSIIGSAPLTESSFW